MAEGEARVEKAAVDVAAVLESTRMKRVRAQHINKKFRDIEPLLASYDGSHKVDLLTLRELLEGKL